MRIERKRLTDQIIYLLISMVARENLKRGDRLPPEHVLMKRFGVGRSHLLEAIGALSLIGQVTVHPGHGSHVTKSPDGFLTKPLGWGMMIEQKASIVGGQPYKWFLETRVQTFNLRRYPTPSSVRI